MDKIPLLDEQILNEAHEKSKEDLHGAACILYNHVRDFKRKRWPEAEEIIKQDPKYAYLYSANYIGKRWPEAEPYIFESSTYAIEYAKNFQIRIPEVEKLLIKNKDSKIVSYACGVIQGPWPEAEEIIKKDADLAHNYTISVIGKRWLPGEPAISQVVDYAYDYAAYTLKDRWPEAEETIAKNPDYAVLYATNVIKGRFELAEPNILKSSPSTIFRYAREVLKQRWPEAENKLGKLKVKYHAHFGIPLDEDSYNKELSGVLFQNKKSPYIKKINDKKKQAIESLEYLISMKIITKEDAESIFRKII